MVNWFIYFLYFLLALIFSFFLIYILGNRETSNIDNLRTQEFYSYFDGKNFDEDKLALETFYRNNGYRDFTILSDTTSVNDEQKHMDIVISVIEGPRYRYRNFSWDGNTLCPLLSSIAW